MVVLGVGSGYKPFTSCFLLSRSRGALDLKCLDIFDFVKTNPQLHVSVFALALGLAMDLALACASFASAFACSLILFASAFALALLI